MEKRISYVDIMPRVTCQYKLDAETFRSRSSSVFETVGRNMQNWSKDTRVVCVPDGLDKSISHKLLAWIDSKYEDYSLFSEQELTTLRVFLQVDQSGAEALIVAYLCKKGKFRELFLQDIKPHVFIGLAFPEHWSKEHSYIYEIQKMDIASVKSHPKWNDLKSAIAGSDNNPPGTRYYYHYKQTCHSANYGIKAPTFQLNMLEKSGGKVVLSKNQAENYLSGYRSMFPEIPDWNQEILDLVSKPPYTLWNLQGFPRLFTNINSADMKDAIAFIPQSTVGVITHVAYTNTQNHIEDNKKQWDLLSNCHDSLLIQCPLMEWKECAKLIQTNMNQPLMSPRGEPFNMKSELQIGLNWSPAKDKKGLEDRYNPLIINKYNLLGLREVKL